MSYVIHLVCTYQVYPVSLIRCLSSSTYPVTPIQFPHTVSVTCLTYSVPVIQFLHSISHSVSTCHQLNTYGLFAQCYPYGQFHQYGPSTSRPSIRSLCSTRIQPLYLMLPYPVSIPSFTHPI